jgi:hypothetical protein
MGLQGTGSSDIVVEGPCCQQPNRLCQESGSCGTGSGQQRLFCVTLPAVLHRPILIRMSWRNVNTPMTQLIPRTQKNPNPQGKGSVPVLQDWAALRPQLPASKSPGDILRDYCLSALVLAAKFRFRPVLGKLYFLYGDERNWTLSLVEPEKWGSAMPGEFVANCRLQADMTWHLELASLHPGSAVLRRLERFIDGFADTISSQDSLIDGLPFYVRSLPYYPRLLATGLAVSLQHSISLTGPDALAKAMAPSRLGSQSGSPQQLLKSSVKQLAPVVLSCAP